ncbi:MAG TPA: ATP-binding protein, partial [Myxococcota bacterium]
LDAAPALPGLGGRIARLVVKPPSPVFDGLKHVVMELMRNVVQHSDLRDDFGTGVVAAQVIEREGVSKRVQIAIADTGIGILAGLTQRQMHRDISNVQTALSNATLPHFSGRFREGQTGTDQNAGLGLYIVSELAKITGGSFLLASRGDALLVRGDITLANERHQFIDNGGYPGTLVVFETVEPTLNDYAALLQSILHRAKARSVDVDKEPATGIVAFVKTTPHDAKRFIVAAAGENIEAARAFARGSLVPALSASVPVALDFVNWTAFSQSYLHALLFVAIRVAWATKTQLFVVNASPVVRTSIEYVESYALAA